MFNPALKETNLDVAPALFVPLKYATFNVRETVK